MYSEKKGLKLPDVEMAKCIAKIKYDNCFSNKFVVMIIPVENFRSTFLLSSSTTAMIIVGLTCL